MSILSILVLGCFLSFKAVSAEFIKVGIYSGKVVDDTRFRTISPRQSLQLINSSQIDNYYTFSNILHDGKWYNAAIPKDSLDFVSIIDSKNLFQPALQLGFSNPIILVSDFEEIEITSLIVTNRIALPKFVHTHPWANHNYSLAIGFESAHHFFTKNLMHKNSEYYRQLNISHQKILNDSFLLNVIRNSQKLSYTTPLPYCEVLAKKCVDDTVKKQNPFVWLSKLSPSTEFTRLGLLGQGLSWGADWESLNHYGSVLLPKAKLRAKIHSKKTNMREYQKCFKSFSANHSE